MEYFISYYCQAQEKYTEASLRVYWILYKVLIPAEHVKYRVLQTDK